MTRAYLLFSDVDNTQCRTSGQRVLAHPELPYTLMLKAAVEVWGLPLIHCSGRSPAHIIRDITGAQNGLKTPHLAQTNMIVASVGTEILEWDTDRAAYVARNDYIDAPAAAFYTDHYDQIRATLADVPGLSLQSADHLGRYKISAWGDKGIDAAAAVDCLRDRLMAIGVHDGNATITASDQGKVAVEVTPYGATKGAAVAFVARAMGVPLDRVIVAGDSLNDLSMMTVPGVRTLLPGNAQAELVDAVRAGATGPVFQAQGGYAKGLFEGLVHFGEIEKVPEIPRALSHLSAWTPPTGAAPGGKLTL